MEILDRISNKFAEFRKNKVFCDCKIVFKEKEVFAHRIILSKYSQFFKNLFISSNDAGIFSFKVEYDPLNTLESIIDFFYNNDIIINYSNIIALIANCNYYKVPVLIDILKDQLIKFINRDTALSFCHQCVEFNVTDHTDNFLPEIAKNWSYYSIQQIYNNVDATILAHLLMDPNLPDMSDDRKIQIIDEFVKKYKNITEKERELFSKVIDWEVLDGYKYFIKHECSWVLPSISRKFLRRIMKERRSTYKKLNNKIETVKADSVSKLFLYSWMLSLRKADSVSDTYSIPIINYMSSFGGLSEGLDPITTGNISAESSPQCGKDRKINDAFGYNKGKYFLSIGSQTQDPYITINFGDSSFLIPHNIILCCTSEDQINEKLSKFKERKKKIDVKTLSPAPSTIEIIGNKNIELYKDEYKDKIPVNTSTPLQELTLKISDNNVAGYKIFRIFSVEIEGEFLPYDAH